jgi:hypothetical protein
MSRTSGVGEKPYARPDFPYMHPACGVAMGSENWRPSGYGDAGGVDYKSKAPAQVVSHWARAPRW